MTRPQVIVVVKRTHYGKYVEEENDPEVRRLLRRRDPSVARWRASHREHVATLHEVERVLDELGARVWLVHGPRVRFDASEASLIVTVGGDGTLLAASHHIGRTPIFGVNSSPDSSVGFFCAGHRGNAEKLLARALAGTLPSVSLARMRVTVNGRVVSQRVLNEALFCHATPAAASRYIIGYGRQKEAQLSSGLWVSTAAGSTGALHSAGGDVLPLESERLQVVVREPFKGHGERYRMTRLFVEHGREVTVTSKMRDGCLFIDGPFQRTSVRLGDKVAFTNSKDPLEVLGLTPRHGRR